MNKCRKMSRKQSKKLPEAAIPMLKYLQDNSPKTQREIMESLDLPTRTVRYSLRRLLERDFIVRIANLNDMRSVYYQINPQIVDLEQVIVQELSIIET